MCVPVPVVDCFINLGSGASAITLRNICLLQSSVVLPPVVNLNMLWHVYGVKQLPDLEGETGAQGDICRPFVLENIHYTHDSIAYVADNRRDTYRQQLHLFSTIVCDIPGQEV